MVYEWEQNLTEIHIYVQPPPGVKANMFDIKVELPYARCSCRFCTLVVYDGVEALR